MGRFLIYGANGYTGDLTTRLAVQRGLAPIVAGRSPEPVERLASELGLESRAFDLADAEALRAGLADVDAVIHMAGPFSATSRPMVDACLATRTHYLDITGEFGVFEDIFARDAEARAAGICLIPGVGFDVVPTDCLAAMLAARLPDATHLELGFFVRGGPSRGTMKTMVEGLGQGGCARVDGKLTRVPTVWRTRDIPFSHGTQGALTIPWGDVSTGYRSTGIPNICVYMAAPRSLRLFFRVVQWLGPVLRSRAVQGWLRRLVQRRAAGPTPAQRENGFSDIWGEARAPDGSVVTGALTAPESYTLTADSSLRAVTRLLAGGVDPGAVTPSKAFGADFVTELDGVAFQLDPRA